MLIVNRIAAGRVTGGHFGLESSFNGGGSMSAATYLKILKSSSVELQDKTRHDSDEATGDRDPADKDSGRYNPFAVDLETYGRLQPDASTASNLETALQAFLGATTVQQTPSGKTVTSGSTTTVVKLATGHGFVLWDAVMIDNEVRIVTKSETTQLTVAPPLSSAPSSGTPITDGRVYHQAAAQPSYWFQWLVDHVVYYNKGITPQSMNISFSGTDRVKLSMKGQGSSQIVTGSTALSSSVGSSALTTFSVDVAKVFEVGSVFDLNGETGITVTAVDYTLNQITVTRGSSPTTHSSGDLCIPQWTDATITGSRAHGMNGVMAIDDGNGNALSVQATVRSIDFNTGSEPVNDEDGATGPTYKFDGERSGSISMTIHFRVNDVRFLRDAQNNATTPVVIWVTAGSRGLAICIPRAEILIPKITQGDMVDMEIPLEIQKAVDADGNRVADRMFSVFTW